MTEDILNPVDFRKQFANVKDLTIIELIMLMFIQSFEGGSVRFQILQEINEFLFQEELSPSSFYHSLKKLEERNLVKTEKIKKTGKKRKVTIVKQTPHTLQALEQVAMFLFPGTIDFSEIYKQVVGKLEKHLDASIHFNKVLIISQDEIKDAHLYPEFAIYIDEFYALADDESYEKYLDGIFTDREIKQSRIEDTVIREPNDFFDATLLTSYRDSTAFFQTNQHQLLKEAVRVTKPNGTILIITIEDPSNYQINHFLVDKMATLFSKNPFTFHYTQQQLQQDLRNNNLENIKILEIQGILIGLGTIP